MPYCTAADVRTLILTNLTDAQIADLITSTDAEIDLLVGGQSTNPLATRLSALMTASTVRAREPAGVTVGEYREEEGDAPEAWRREIQAILRALKAPAVKATGYTSIDETRRAPG
jgi:predicted transcriptional regulator